MDLDRIEAIERENKALREMIAELAVTQAEAANALASLVDLLLRQERSPMRHSGFYTSDLFRQMNRAKAVGASALSIAEKAGVS